MAPKNPPVAADKSVTTQKDTPVNITLSATDIEDCELTFAIVTGPTSGGSLSTITDNICTSGNPNVDTVTVTYTSTSGFAGVDTFTYKARDSGPRDSNIASVTVKVSSPFLTVSRTGDGNDLVCNADCSLREAIGAISSGGTIKVPAGTYSLTLGSELVIEKDLILMGAASGDTIIQAATGRGEADFRVFNITTGNVSVSGVTIRNGYTKERIGGGGILNNGALTQNV